MKILLMGNPNVGKSALFSRLTGVDVIISNYAGTTVEYKQSTMLYRGGPAELIDVPGTYSLKPTNKAEEVAVKMLKEGDLIVNVVDATNLERNLNLTFQLMESGIPMVIALNIWDDAKHIGITIDYKKLGKLLKMPVIPTVAVTGEGIKDLVNSFSKAKKPKLNKHNEKERWEKIGKTVNQVQTAVHKHHTFLERLSDASIKPSTGIVMALMAMLVSFFVIRVIGENLINYVFNPIFELYRPLVAWLSNNISSVFLHNLIIGRLIDGKIDFIQSMGLLTTGIYAPIAMIMPYIISFYFVMGIWEDSGYLPRLAVLTDGLMHKIGMHGFAVIPMMLGFGCKVAGTLSTRVLESRREKFIAITLMSICVPCAAQTAMVIGLLGQYGIKGLGIVFLTLFVVFTLLGLILHKFIKGKSHETFIEIPPYRLPNSLLFKKLFIRIKWYFKEALPYVLLGVLVANVLDLTGVMAALGKIASPVVVNVLGLPEGAVAALIVGLFRKYAAIGIFLPLGLSFKQSVIAGVVWTMYFPCIAVFSVLVKELGLKDSIKSVLIMISSALAVGWVLNLVL